MTQVKKLLEAAADKQNAEPDDLAEALTLHQKVREALAKMEAGGQGTGEKAGAKPGAGPKLGASSKRRRWTRCSTPSSRLASCASL